MTLVIALTHLRDALVLEVCDGNETIRVGQPRVDELEFPREFFINRQFKDTGGSVHPGRYKVFLFHFIHNKSVDMKPNKHWMTRFLMTAILPYFMMTSSNINMPRIAGPLGGDSLVTGEFPWQRSVTRSFDVFFDLCLNKRLSKQSRHRGFETPTRSLWCHAMWWLITQSVT